MKKKKPLYSGYEWSPDMIEKIWDACDKIGKEDLQLDYHPPQFDIVTSEQMLDAYSSVGMPVFYNHWSFGKQFAQSQQAYRSGKMGLAYEMVINSNPCLAYLMEDNTATCTTLVIAHANVGHASFFKMNYLFQQHTDADSILNYLEYAKRFIFRCEEEHGQLTVEKLLDDLHIIAKFGVDKYPKKPPQTAEHERKALQDRMDNERLLYDEVFNTLPDYDKGVGERVKALWEALDDLWRDDREKATESVKEENLLRFIINNSLVMQPWQREITKIVMNIEQYFYPQGQTKIMNEGWACFCHYYIMSELYKQGDIDEGAYLEFLQLHTGVCNQWPMQNLNPYVLGFEIFMDLKRACEDPDEEDYKYLNSIAGKKDWRTELKNIVKYYKDESFVLQFLGPKVIRKLKLFSYMDDSNEEYYEITGIQGDEDIEKIRRTLCSQIELDNRRPDFEVVGINRLRNRVDINYKKYKEREIENLDLFFEVVLRLTGMQDFNVREV